ncbi:MAG: DUF3048 domain-containing protein [Acidimicrobiales bacterium]
MTLRTRAALAALVATMTAAACTGGGDDAAELTTTTDGTADTTTTSEVMVDDTTTTSAAPAPAGPGMPLTGLPIDESIADRPALVIKIDNHPRARPQTGLDLADLVFEVRAEGVTRFMGVFHSQTPDPVGPVRSSRTSDFDLLRGLDNPLYASSGGNDYVANGLRNLPIQQATALSLTDQYFRDGSRPAPHNLYSNASSLWELAAEDSTAPGAWFTYRDEGDELSSSATEITGAVTVSYRGSPVVTHTWDAAVGGWLRTQDGRPHTTIGGDQLAPENVVIMVADYRVSAADPASPEVVSVGTGQLYVLTDGHAITGTWSRETAEGKPELVDDSGNEIALTRGRTWILMPEPGDVTLPAS